MFTHDVAVVGAGAAGLFCAGVAAQRGARVALIDHAPKLAEKIRISGGGRCNFTNVEGDRPERYVGERPGFHRAALKAYRPADFIALVQRYRIPFHEKHRGQLFCDESAEALIAMLRAECEAGGVHWWRPVQVEAVRRITVEGRDGFAVDTSGGEVRAAALVVATGGLSIPKIGATDLGYRLATQFGHRIVPTRPALVPLTFPAEAWAPFAALAGLSLPVRIRAGVHDARFDEDLLFTHRGLSGPAVLQISTFWRDGDALVVDLAPGRDVGEALVAAKAGARQQLATALSELLPRRLAQHWLEHGGWAPQARLAEVGDKALRALGAALHGWRLTPDGSEGWRKAEVTAGGVATDEIDPRTMASRRVPGLHFVGEVLDVTGWLGGYNFQWAWSSAQAAAMALTAR